MKKAILRVPLHAYTRYTKVKTTDLCNNLIFHEKVLESRKPLCNPYSCFICPWVIHICLRNDNKFWFLQQRSNIHSIERLADPPAMLGILWQSKVTQFWPPSSALKGLTHRGSDPVLPPSSFPWRASLWWPMLPCPLSSCSSVPENPIFPCVSNLKKVIVWPPSSALKGLTIVGVDPVQVTLVGLEGPHSRAPVFPCFPCSSFQWFLLEFIFEARGRFKKGNSLASLIGAWRAITIVGVDPVQVTLVGLEGPHSSCSRVPMLLTPVDASRRVWTLLRLYL